MFSPHAAALSKFSHNRTHKKLSPFFLEVRGWARNARARSVHSCKVQDRSHSLQIIIIFFKSFLSFFYRQLKNTFLTWEKYVWLLLSLRDIFRVVNKRNTYAVFFRFLSHLNYGLRRCRHAFCKHSPSLKGNGQPDIHSPPASHVARRGRKSRACHSPVQKQARGARLAGEVN